MSISSNYMFNDFGYNSTSMLGFGTGFGMNNNFPTGIWAGQTVFNIASLIATNVAAKQGAGAGGSAGLSQKQQAKADVQKIDEEIKQLEGTTKDNSIEKELDNYDELQRNITAASDALKDAKADTRKKAAAVVTAKADLKVNEEALAKIDQKNNPDEYEKAEGEVEKAKTAVKEAEEAETKAKAKEVTTEEELQKANDAMSQAVKDYKETKISELQEKRRDILADNEKVKFPKDFDVTSVQDANGEYVSVETKNNEIDANTSLSDKQKVKAKKEAVKARLNAFNATFSQYSNETDPDKKADYKQKAVKIYQDINNTNPDEIDKDLKRRYQILTQEKPSIAL